MDSYVIVRLRNSRTGKHVYREGPYSRADAEEEARLWSEVSGVYSVYITEGSPYHTDSNTTTIYRRVG